MNTVNLKFSINDKQVLNLDLNEDDLHQSYLVQCINEKIQSTQDGFKVYILQYLANLANSNYTITQYS